MPKAYMYILECADGSYYTGSTKNLELRLQQHQNGEGANHTAKRLPVKLVYYEEFQRIDDAFYREKQVQGWNRAKKESLIHGTFENLTHQSIAYRDRARTEFSKTSEANNDDVVPSRASGTNEQHVVPSECSGINELNKMPSGISDIEELNMVPSRTSDTNGQHVVPSRTSDIEEPNMVPSRTSGTEEQTKVVEAQKTTTPNERSKVVEALETTVHKTLKNFYNQ